MEEKLKIKEPALKEINEWMLYYAKQNESPQIKGGILVFLAEVTNYFLKTIEYKFFRVLPPHSKQF